MKRNNLMKLLSLVLACIMAFGVLTACGTKASEAPASSVAEATGSAADDGGIGIAGQPYKVAVGVLTFTVDYFKEVAYGAIQAR